MPYRHHGEPINMDRPPGRGTMTRDSIVGHVAPAPAGRGKQEFPDKQRDGSVVYEFNTQGGPKGATLPTPPTISMPSPTSTQRFTGWSGTEVLVPPPSEYRTTEPPPGMSAEAIALANERYWTQASGLPEVERNRRAGVEYQKYLDRWWSGKPAFVNFGAPAKDETGRLMEELCRLESDDGAGNLSGTTEGGDFYEIRQTPVGYTLARERKKAAPALAPISDSEAGRLRRMNERAAAFWAKPFGQR